MSSTMRPDELCREILDSIKTLDARINELSLIVRSSNDRRQRTTKRIEKLIDTRFKLTLSIMDVISKNKLNPMSVFGKLDFKYHQFKRQIMTGKTK